MTEARATDRPPELNSPSDVENAIAPVRDGIRLEQANQALDNLFGRRVTVADAKSKMPGRYTAIEGIHPAPAPVELPHQYYESPVALGPAHPSKAMGGAIFDQSIGTWRPRTGLDVATTTTGLPPGMEGDFVRTAEQRGQIAAELEARQQKESFAALSGSEQLSVKVYDLVRAAERVPQNIRKVVTTVWEQANGLIPRINTKFNVALSAAASMAALAACGGALPKSPEPTPTPRIVQTVDVVKPTATATTPFETPTPPAVTKEQLANVLIQQDTYTADVVESWKGDMTPTQLLARKVLKGELGPEDDAAEVRSMSYSMKNAGGFSFDIAASASDQSKMRIGFVSPDGSLQMRDVRAVQEQNGAVSLLMTQEGKILVIARRSLDGTAFVINPADASGVIKKIGDNSPDLSLGKDIIVIPPSPTPGPKQPNLDLLAYLFPPQTVKAESQPTPGPTAGNVFSGTVEPKASVTPEADVTPEVKRMQAKRLTDNVSVLPDKDKKYITDTQPLIDALRKSNPEAEKILNGLYYLSVAALMDKNPNPTEARVTEVQAQIEAARKAGKPFYIEEKVQDIAGWDKDGRPLFQTASEAAAKLSKIDLAKQVIVSFEEEPDMQTRLKKGGTGDVNARFQVAINPQTQQLYINLLLAPGVVADSVTEAYAGNKGLFLAIDTVRAASAPFLWASSVSPSVSTAPMVTYPTGSEKAGQARLTAWNIANDFKFKR